MIRKIVALGVAMTIGACVQQADLDSWQGQPVALLDMHPFFNTLPVEIRRLPDGTEIRNYVNGANLSRCFGGANANAYGGRTVYVTGNSFCSTGFAACNNQFYVRGGKVLQYVPIGSGGARCMTDQRVRPVHIG